MNQQERAIIDLVINGQQAKASLKDIEKSVYVLRGEIKKMREADDPKLYAQKTEELKKLNAAYSSMSNNLKQVTSSWQRFKKEVSTIATGVVGGNLMAAGIQQLAMFIPNTIKKIVELKDSIADIAKTTGMTVEQATKFNKELSKIDTRTARKELREMTVIGGQFGIATDQMLGFVDGADKLNVALGDQFEGASAVAETMVKLRNILQDIKTDNVGEDMLHIGNAINVLE
ncbi:MAG: hypothetical protein WBP45_15740, partial [Daejeonella sp.]